MKNRSSKKPKSTNSISTDVSDQVSELNMLVPDSKNFEKIKMLLQKTFLNRKAMVMQGISLKDIVLKYPRIIDYHGDMVGLSFFVLFSFV